jgi:hypothetical protein
MNGSSTSCAFGYKKLTYNLLLVAAWKEEDIQRFIVRPELGFHVIKAPLHDNSYHTAESKAIYIFVRV